MSQTTSRPARGPVNRVAPANPEPVENRDPNNLNSHVQQDFYSVFAEPSTAPQSFDCIWEFSELCYGCMNECTYKLISLLCGVCVAIGWGLEFVPVLFSHIWCFTPCNQVVAIVIGVWCKSFWHLLARLCIAPCTNACSALFIHCGDGVKRRPESPPLFPRRPKKKPAPKPVEEKKDEPVEEKRTVAPVVVAAATSDFEDMDKNKMANSVKRQLLLY